MCQQNPPSRSTRYRLSRGHAHVAFVPAFVVVFVIGVLLAGVLASGCTERSDPFDREAAIAKVLEEGQGTLNRQQAECYVDRVTGEIGSAQLVTDATRSPSQISKLTSIRIDCIGVANLGRAPATGTMRPVAPEETSARRQPQRRGDDTNLDLLYDACATGNGQACDTLFENAPAGSEYEEFAVTCGGRTREKRCADVYGPVGGAPSTTATQPPPTQPPPKR